MSRRLESQISVDLSYYEDTQLADNEIVERESVRQAWAEYHAATNENASAA
ncbi:MAG: hypothetical protein ACTHLZ_16995 [Tepidisphaeraceae bacterium]